MTCPNCGRVNEEGTNFCVGCGTKLEKQTQPMADNEIFQPTQAIENEAVESATEELIPEEPAPEELITSDPEPSEPESAEPTPIEELIPIAPKNISPDYDKLKEIVEDSNPKPKKQRSSVSAKLDMGIVKKIGIGAIIVIAIIVLISCLRSCSSGKMLDAEKYPVFFEAGDEIKYLTVGQKKSNMLADEDDLGRDDDICITADGKYIFFSQDYDYGEYDLYCRDLSKKDADANVRIAKNVTDYMISPDGSVVIYIQDNDIYKTDRNGKKSVKLAKDFGYNVFDEEAEFDINDDFTAIIYENDEGEVYYSTGVDKIHNEIYDDEDYLFSYFSEDGKKIAVILYEMDEDTYESYYTVCVCGTGKKDKPEEIESELEDYWFIGDSFDSMYYIKEGKLYIKEGTKKGKEIGGLDGDAMRVTCATDDDKNEHFYVITKIENDDEYKLNLYYIDGNKVKLLIEDYQNSYYYGSKIVDNYNRNKDDEKYYVRIEYDNFVEIDIPKEDGETVSYYCTENNFYTIENYRPEKGTGDLVKYEITEKGIDFNKGVTIADDVESIDTSYAEFFDKETIFIKHDYEEYSVYYGGKEAVEIDEDVHDFLWFGKDGTMILAVDLSSKNYTYTIAKFDGKKLVEIVDGAYDAVVFGEKSIYYTDKSDNLYFNKGKLSNKDTLIEEDVYDLLNPIDYVIKEKGTKANFVIPALIFEN